jgi:plasmid stabilization system protein ParE
MIGYDFHPEARLDLDEIWEFIRSDNLDAADRVIADVFEAVRALVPFPQQGHRRPDLTSLFAVYRRSRILDCLRAG